MCSDDIASINSLQLAENWQAWRTMIPRSGHRGYYGNWSVSFQTPPHEEPLSSQTVQWGPRRCACGSSTYMEYGVHNTFWGPAIRDPSSEMSLSAGRDMVGPDSSLVYNPICFHKGEVPYYYKKIPIALLTWTLFLSLQAHLVSSLTYTEVCFGFWVFCHLFSESGSFQKPQSLPSPMCLPSPNTL